MHSLSLAIAICPELITTGDVLTSGDLHAGHNDLCQPMLVDPTEANINTPKTPSLLACGRYMPQLESTKL